MVLKWLYKIVQNIPEDEYSIWQAPLNSNSTPYNLDEAENQQGNS